MDNLFNNAYKGKKVLITGHTGFKGSWLALWLSQLGADVVGFSKDIPTEPNHFNLLKLNITSIEGDILDKVKLEQTINEHNPEIIFHLAAQALVRKSYNIPVETIETNIMGTTNVLEAVRKNDKVKAVVNITSDKCYQNDGLARGYREDDPMGGDDPYSASKGAVELIAHAYRKSFFNLKDYGTKHHTLLADVRAGNVVGGGDWALDRIIPDMMRAASVGNKLETRNPHATRPWQHVLEALSGYLAIGAKLLNGEKDFAEDWNFGPNDDAAIPVEAVIKIAMKYWDAIEYEKKPDPHNLHEAPVLSLDSTKARTKLHWKSVWDSEATFGKTVAWYKAFYTEKNIISEENLAAYIADAKKAGIAWAQ